MKSANENKKLKRNVTLWLVGGLAWIIIAIYLLINYSDLPYSLYALSDDRVSREVYGILIPFLVLYPGGILIANYISQKSAFHYSTFQILSFAIAVSGASLMLYYFANMATSIN